MTAAPQETADERDARTREDLRAQVDLLQAENRRLRTDRARAHRDRHRRSAAGLAALGVLAALGAVAFPDARTVLFALAGVGLFAGLLVVYLAPGRFVAADVGGALSTARADTADALVGELGLADDRVYVPRATETDPVRLFLPQHAAYAVPDDEALAPLFVVTEDPDARGVSLHPSGVPLLRELESALSAPLADEPGPLADQLVDGLVEDFELVDRATPDVSADGGRVSVAIGGVAFGEVERVDHPVASLLAVGLAAGLDRPVRLEAARSTDDRADVVVTCRVLVDDSTTAAGRRDGDDAASSGTDADGEDRPST